MSLRDRLLEPDGLFRGALFQDLLRKRFLDDSLHENDRVGAWRIVRELGRGGMGVVFLAERADGEFEQRVALKWLPDTGMSAEHASLFRRERQFLAELSHPNIARLVDGGHSDDGHLWFAMEYVEGLPIDRHAQTHALDERARVALLLPVVEAVEFAHSRLLIHRDIKPGNVLIDEQGRPKLLDFGIAGLAQESDLAHAFTPDYASPEQRALQPVGTASDVWQLGRLLEAVLRIGATRETARDLQAIVRMATADAPQDRYPTATAFKYDLQRWLARKPVRARGGGPAYVLRRLLQRHPLGAAGALFATATLFAMAIGFVWYAAAERAHLRQARDETMAINDFLTDDVLGASDPFAGNGEGKPVADILESNLQKVEQRFHDHPRISARIEIALGYALVAHGRLASGRRAADRALALLTESDGLQSRSTAEARLLRAYYDVARGAPAVAQTRLDALEADFPYVRNAPSPLEWRIQNTRAWNLMLLNRPEECIATYTRILDRPQHIEDTDLADAYNSLSMCQTTSGRYREALATAYTSERYAVRSSGPRSGNAVIARLRIAIAMSGLGRRKEATQLFEQQVNALVQLVGENHGATATYMDHLGSLLLCTNDNERASEWTRRAMRARIAVYGPDHAWAVGVEGMHLIALVRAGHMEEAAQIAAVLERRTTEVDDPISQIWAYRGLAEWHLRMHRNEQAASYFESARRLATPPVLRIHANLHAIDAGLALSLQQAKHVNAARAVLARYAGNVSDGSGCVSPLTLEADALLAHQTNPGAPDIASSQ